MSLGGDFSEQTAITEINITPFVDVVLVLLVIFIVTAPMLMKEAIKLNLPKVTQSQAMPASTLAITITKTGQFLLQGQLVTSESLGERARQEKTENSEVQGIIAADLECQHRYVVEVIDILKSSGIENFAIQVEHQAKP